jgi:hypothetical protein
MHIFPLWYLTRVDRTLALWSLVHSIGVSSATVYASSAMKITVEIVWRGFKRGRVASIGVFGVARSDAGLLPVRLTGASSGVGLSPTLSIIALFFVGPYK